jgi:hypothetical protein
MGATFFDRPPVTARRYVFRPPFTVAFREQALAFSRN